MNADDLLSLLHGVRRTSRGWWARCPAHKDKTPSLKIDEAEDGRILLHCFAGCTAPEICSALHIEVRDLFPQFERNPHRICIAQQARQHREQAQQRVRHVDGVCAALFREAEAVITAGSLIDSEALSTEQLDRFLDVIGEAHNTLRSEMGEQDYAEWSSRLGADHCTIAVG